MNLRSPVVLLGALAIILAIVIVFELLPEPTESAVAVRETPAAAEAVPEAAPAGAEDAAADAVPTLLARPLFQPSRHAPEGPKKVADANEGSTDLPRLAGIIFTDALKRAIFQADKSDKSIVVGEGEDISGWTVDKIARNEVSVSGPGGTETLQPKYDPNFVPPEPAMPQAGEPPENQRPKGRPPGMPPLVNPRDQANMMFQNKGRQPGALPPLPPNLRHVVRPGKRG